MKNYKQYVAVGAAVAIILLFGIMLAFSNNKSAKKSGSDSVNNQELIKTTENENNPASQIGEGEFKIDKDNFQKEVIEFKGIVMVDFFLPTCPHCQKVGPVISEIAKETQGKYKIGKINANTNPEKATEFSIQSVPALIFFKDGKEVDRLIGARGKAEILAKLDEVSKK